MSVDGVEIATIGYGLLVLLAVTHEDEQKDADWLIKKIIQLRIFSDDEGKMNLSVQDVKGDLLVVSQFTLYANYKKGNRPSYAASAPPAVAIPLYDYFVENLKQMYQEGAVRCGVFGADMKVSLLNDGPVTIIMDSRQPE